MFGIEVYDQAGRLTLSPSDFTIRKIYEATVPESSGFVAADRDDYLTTLTIPNYNPSTCFVVFTPLSYNTSQQSGSGLKFIPAYRDTGGNSIHIVTGVRCWEWNGGGDSPVTYYNTVESRLEVFEVLG